MLRRDCGPATSSRPGWRNSTGVSSPSRRPCTSPPTARAAFNLRRENVPETNIRVVGNTVVDALLYTRDRVASGYRLIEPALAALPTDKKLVLATTHRHENIGTPYAT